MRMNVLVTVGHDLDPAILGPQPGNIAVVRFVPQAAALSRCDVVVCHGGSGTVMAALALGRPMVILPMGADQPLNAGRAQALGVARVLDPVRATPRDVAQAVAAVSTDPAVAAHAGAWRDECLALPGPDHAAALLERLAVERRPILGP
jgi:MGT family glycosyltransferase